MNEQEQIRKRSKEKTSVLFLEHGKLPPQAIDLEETVLGAAMLEKDALMLIISYVRYEMFYKESHQKIYKAILDLFNKSEPIDILTVTSQLKKNGELDIVGGPFYITQLTSRVASSANIEYHSRIIIQKFIQREIIRIGSNSIRDAFEDTTDVFELLEKFESDLFKISQSGFSKESVFYHTQVDAVLRKIIKLKNQEIKLLGVPSGFVDLDRITKGFQNSDLIILAARPGMGKTTAALNFAFNAAKDYNKKIAFFSLEMSMEQLTQKIISLDSCIELSKIHEGKIEDYEFEKLMNYALNSTENIIIDDTPALTLFELRSKARRLKQQHNIEMIVIDYLQLMKCDVKKNGNREQEISHISQGLKALAKELNIPVIALSQLNRKVEERGGLKRPMLQDLRESGAIEQDADLIIFLWRAEYYKQEYLDFKGTQYLSKAVVLIDIAKHRNGSTDECLLNFKPKISKFYDFNDSPFTDEINNKLPECPFD